MTATTPGSALPKTPISPVATRGDLIAMIHNRDALISDLKEALASARLAAKPAEEVREATIQECAKVCDGIEKAAEMRANGLPSQSPSQDAAYDKAAAANTCARTIRALSTTGQPKP